MGETMTTCIICEPGHQMSYGHSHALCQAHTVTVRGGSQLISTHLVTTRKVADDWRPRRFASGRSWRPRWAALVDGNRWDETISDSPTQAVRSAMEALGDCQASDDVTAMPVVPA